MGFSTVKRKIRRRVGVEIEHTPKYGNSILALAGSCEEGDLIETWAGSGTRLYELVKEFTYLEYYEEESSEPVLICFWEARLVDWDVEER